MPSTWRGRGVSGPRSSGLNSRALAVSPRSAAAAQAANSSQRSYTACGSAANVPPLASATSRPCRSSVSRVSRPDTLAIRIGALQRVRGWALPILRLPRSGLSPRGRTPAGLYSGRSGVLQALAEVLQLVDQLRGLGLGQVLGYVLVGLAGQR